MRRLAIVLTGLLATTLVAAVAGEVAAQTEGAALVKERQDEMKQMGRGFKVLMPIVKGENPNLSDAVETAQTVNTNAKKILPNFPEGTGRDAIPDSRAKPEVWTKSAEFKAAADKLVGTSGELLKAVQSNDLEAFQVSFKAYAQACGGCHESKGGEGGEFRYPRE